MTPFDTFNCGRLLPDDAPRAAEVIQRYGGTAKATRKGSAILLVGYFTNGLTHQQRVGIASAMGNEGIFAL